MYSRWQSTIVDAQGNVQPGARLVVFLEETQERAQVYRDRDGTDPYPLGEVVANEWGYAYFYAAPNSYRITSAPLAIDWREVVVAGEWLLEAESNAAQSAAQALLSAQSATASAATASTSASAASDSAANAESSETNAAASAASAQGSATQASSSAADAANSASSAAQSASDSESYADSAQVFSQDAESSKTLAEQWAQNPEDVPVAPGLFSAFHWAKKAEGFVGGDAYMQKSANLSDVQDVSAARDNLGLGNVATQDFGTTAGTVMEGNDSRVAGALQKSANLSDVQDVPTSRDNLGLGTAATRDVVGTVSQSGGVPTGAIIEIGSNANGEYVRWADGSQICRLRIKVTDQVIAAVYTPGLYQGIRDWVFPVEFSNPPSVTCSEFHWGNSASWGTLGEMPSAEKAILRGIDSVSRAAGTETSISAIAVGRWY